MAEVPRLVLPFRHYTTPASIAVDAQRSTFFRSQMIGNSCLGFSLSGQCYGFGHCLLYLHQRGAWPLFARLDDYSISAQKLYSAANQVSRRRLPLRAAGAVHTFAAASRLKIVKRARQKLHQTTGMIDVTFNLFQLCPPIRCHLL